MLIFDLKKEERRSHLQMDETDLIDKGEIRRPKTIEIIEQLKSDRIT